MPLSLVVALNFAPVFLSFAVTVCFSTGSPSSPSTRPLTMERPESSHIPGVQML